MVIEDWLVLKISKYSHKASWLVFKIEMLKTSMLKTSILKTRVHKIKKSESKRKYEENKYKKFQIPKSASVCFKN